jgi:hypothetical protein
MVRLRQGSGGAKDRLRVRSIRDQRLFLEGGLRRSLKIDQDVYSVVSGRGSGSVPESAQC